MSEQERLDLSADHSQNGITEDAAMCSEEGASEDVQSMNIAFIKANAYEGATIEEVFELNKQLAKNHKQLDSMITLAEMYCDGKGTDQDIIKGQYWIKEVESRLIHEEILDPEIYNTLAGLYWSGKTTKDGKPESKGIIENAKCKDYSLKAIDAYNHENKKYGYPKHDIQIGLMNLMIDYADEQIISRLLRDHTTQKVIDLDIHIEEQEAAILEAFQEGTIKQVLDRRQVLSQETKDFIHKTQVRSVLSLEEKKDIYYKFFEEWKEDIKLTIKDLETQFTEDGRSELIPRYKKCRSKIDILLSLVNNKEPLNMRTLITSDELEKIYDKKVFTEIQWSLISEGCDILTKEEIDLYAKWYYKPDQMKEIRLGIENGLTIEQISTYTDKAFSAEQMKQIREDFENGLTKDQIDTYADNSFSTEQMKQIQQGFTNGLIKSQIDTYADSSFTPDQMKQRRLGLEIGLTKELIDAYTDKAFAAEQLKEIRLGFEIGLTKEQIEIYANLSFSKHQMEQIRKGFEIGLTIEQIDICVGRLFSENQLEEIRKGFEIGLTKEQIEVYANESFSIYQMEQIRKGFEIGLEIEQIKICVGRLFTEDQIEEIRQGFEDGLPKEQIEIYADESFSAEYMEEIRKGLKGYLTCDQAKISMQKTYPNTKMEQLRKGFKLGLFPKQIKLMANPLFSVEQIEVIYRGFESGLSTQEVKLYARPEIRYIMMDTMRKLLLESKYELTEEFVNLIIDRKFTPYQMMYIVRQLLKGIPFEKIDMIN